MKIWYFILIMAAVCNRASFTGVGSVAQMIQKDLLLTSGETGFITTIILLSFSVGSALVNILSKRIDTGKFMMIAFTGISAGVLMRSLMGAAGLFMGTLLIGLGIAVSFTLMPVIIKDVFPGKSGWLMGFYVAGMSCFSGISSGIAVPLANMTTWKFSLLIWVVPALLALTLWTRRKDYNLKTVAYSGIKEKTVFRYRLTWYIALFMGLQSLVYYCYVAWFASIAAARGFSEVTAGYFYSVYTLMGIPGGFIIPVLVAKRENQKKVVIGAMSIYIVGIIATIFSGEMPWLLAVATLCCGFCQGGVLAIVLPWFASHTRDTQRASQLSGAAQAVGFLIAAIGPALMGKIYDMTQAWTPPLVALLAVVTVLLLLGLRCSEEEYI